MKKSKRCSLVLRDMDRGVSYCKALKKVLKKRTKRARKKLEKELSIYI